MAAVGTPYRKWTRARDAFALAYQIEQARQREHERMMDALYPLADLWGEEAYNAWVDANLADEMSVDQIIEVAKRFYPGVNPL